MNDWYYRILREVGRQVDKRVLQIMAHALNVQLNVKMHTGEMAANIVEDSYGHPTSSEQRGLDRIAMWAASTLESDDHHPSGQDREDIFDALAWLARRGKRKL